MLSQILQDILVNNGSNFIRISLIVKLRLHHRSHRLRVDSVVTELEVLASILSNHLLDEHVPNSWFASEHISWFRFIRRKVWSERYRNIEMLFNTQDWSPIDLSQICKTCWIIWCLHSFHSSSMYITNNKVSFLHFRLYLILHSTDTIRFISVTNGCLKNRFRRRFNHAVHIYISANLKIAFLQFYLLL